MRTSEVISSLQHRGVTLKIVAGSLKIGGVDRLTDREKAMLKAHKGAILRVLGRTPTPTGQAVPAPVRASTAATTVSTANRQAMPLIASVMDQFREVCGTDQVRVAYAEEAGRKFGTPQSPGIKPVLIGDKVPMPSSGRQEDTCPTAECRTCLRFDPRANYCGHKLHVIHEGEMVICAGRGYSPKGEPGKESRP